MNAQDAYKLFVNTYLSPALRIRGFQGSAGNYTIANSHAYVLLGLQKSRWNDKDKLEFTINISVVSKHIWSDAIMQQPWLSKLPSPNAVYPVEMWHTRLGMISKEKRDTWWNIQLGTNLEEIADDITNKIDSYALPAITEQLGKLRK